MPIEQPFNREPNQLQTPQPAMSYNPFSVILGTAAEEFASQLSFRLYTPDLIKQNIEEMYPMSTTVGKIAGSIAGFGASLWALGGIGRGILGLTSFGRTILGTSKLVSAYGAAAGTGKTANLFRGGVGVVKTGSLFGVHDVVQEFLRQYKEKDPDVYQAGIAAASGFFQGAAFGFAQSAFTAVHPIKQMMAGGVAFTLADTINRTAYGEIMEKEDYARAFLTGAIFSGISSRGWKGRRAGFEKIAVNNAQRFMDNMTDNPNTKLMISEMFEIVKFGKVKDIQKFFVNATRKIPVPKDDVINETFYRKGEPWSKQKQRFKNFQQLRKDIQIPDESYRNKMFEMTGKRTSADLTVGEGHQMMQWLQEEARSFVMEGIDVTKITPLRGFDKNLRPIDRSLLRNHLTQVLGFTEKASRMSAVHKNSLYRAVDVLVDKWDRGSGVKFKEKAQGFLKNKPLAKQQELIKILESADKPEEFLAMTKNLNKEQRDAVYGLRRITLGLYNRMNEVLEAAGKEKIPYREAYFPHILKQVKEEGMKPALSGKIADIMPFKTEKERLIRPESQLKKPRIETRKLTDTAVAESGKYELDPRKALKAMVHQDLKTIWLETPVDILKGRMMVMSKNDELSNKMADDIAWYVNTFVIGKPTQHAREMDDAVYRLLTTGKVGQATEKFMGYFNRKVSQNPLTVARSFYGLSVTRAYIFARPALAIRNMMQSFYVHAYTDTYSMLKAMGTRKLPKELQDMIDSSPTIKAQFLEAEEGMLGAHSKIDEVAAQMFANSQVFNVRFAAKAAYYQAKTWVSGTNPLYRKAGIDWSDADGRKIRMDAKAAKNSKWHTLMSTGEKKAVQQWIEHVTSHTQFVYHATGLPAVFRDPLWGAAFKLQSYPMNYVFKYMADTGKMLRTGTAGFDTTGKYKVPINVRAGFLKHFIGLGLAVKIFEEAGMNFSDIVGFSYDPDKEGTNIFEKESGFKGLIGKGTEKITKVRLGVLSFRPSPAVGMFLNFRDIWSEDKYTSRKAIKNLTSGAGVFVPGFLAGKDIKRTLEQGERRALFVRKPFEPRGKKKKEPLNESFYDIYKSHSGYRPFKSY